MTFLGVKLRPTELPKGVRFKQMLGIDFLAGAGFTMSIFIANLAFMDSSKFIDSAKVGILIGSFISGTAGYIVLRLSSRKKVLSTDTKSN
jgi:NhaA family Na+:H+ antiporter